MRKMVLAALAATMVCGAAAGAATVNFEDVSSSQTNVTLASVSSGGLTFRPTAGTLAVISSGSSCSPLCSDNGSKNLLFGTPTGSNPASTAPLLITASAAFSLTGFDYAEIGPTGLYRNASTLTVVGTLIGGGTMSRLLNLDGISDGPGGVADFQTAVFDNDFATNLFTSVAITGTASTGAPGGFELDNLLVNYAASSAPEPASWAMMTIGFGLLGAAMRRRSASIALV